jgi:hypothetical protein
MWHGSHAFAWWRMLAKNGLAIHPKYYGISLVTTVTTAIHATIRTLQQATAASKAAQTPLSQDPLFIIGHWRTGTTLLHELFIEDPRHSYPTTYRCMDPNHFLLTENAFKPYLNFMLPSQRPMDSMATGWEKPQEDEFALAMLGAPSPYWSIAFPNLQPQDTLAYEVENLPPNERKRWERVFMSFLRECAWAAPPRERRMVLKSPTHSWRIPTLLKLFPKARFVHIVRDPYVVFPSTVNLWRSLQRTHGLQIPNLESIEEQVFGTFSWMYNRLEATRHLVPQGQFAEVRYEDLVANPLSQMERLYHELDLGGFDVAGRHIQGYLDSQKGYETNKFKPLPTDVEADISRRWGDVIDRYGYPHRGQSHPAP